MSGPRTSFSLPKETLKHISDFLGVKLDLGGVLDSEHMYTTAKLCRLKKYRKCLDYYLELIEAA